MLLLGYVTSETGGGEGGVVRPNYLKEPDSVLDTDRQAGLGEWLHEVYEGSEVGAENERLAVAAQIVEEMRAAVYRDTGFRCSAGIAHNKVGKYTDVYSLFEKKYDMTQW